MPTQRQGGRLFVGARRNRLVDRRPAAAGAYGATCRHSSPAAHSSRRSVVGVYILVTERGRSAGRSFRAIGAAGARLAVLLAVSLVVVLHRAELRFRRERALHAGARTDLRRRARNAARRPGLPAHLGGDGGRRRRRGADGRQARPRPSAVGPALSLLDVGLVRGDDRDHAPPARRLDGARDVPLTGSGPRRRRAVRIRCRPARPTSLLLATLGLAQIGLGFIFLTIGAG